MSSRRESAVDRVYAMLVRDDRRTDHLFKVGYSNDPEARRRQGQTFHDVPLEIIWTQVPPSGMSAPTLERALHGILEPMKVGGVSSRELFTVSRVYDVRTIMDMALECVLTKTQFDHPSLVDMRHDGLYAELDQLKLALSNNERQVDRLKKDLGRAGLEMARLRSTLPKQDVGQCLPTQCDTGRICSRLKCKRPATQKRKQCLDCISIDRARYARKKARMAV